MYEDSATVLAGIRRDAQAAHDRADAAVRFRQQVATTTGTASSPDRSVSATVDASGLLVDLTLKDAATMRRGADLAELIRQTVYEAQQDAARQVMAQCDDAFGTDAPVTGRMRAELDQRFRAPEPQDGSWLSSGGGR